MHWPLRCRKAHLEGGKYMSEIYVKENESLDNAQEEIQAQLREVRRSGRSEKDRVLSEPQREAPQEI